MSIGGVNEASEDRPVVVEGVITQPVSPDMPFGYKFYVDDGSGAIQIFVSASTFIDVSGFTPGQYVCAVGFSG